MNHALYWFKAVLSKSCFLLPVFIGNNNYIVTIYRMTTYTESGDNNTEISNESDLVDSFTCTQTRSYR